MPQLIEYLFTLAGAEALLPLVAIGLVVALILGSVIGRSDRRH